MIKDADHIYYCTKNQVRGLFVGGDTLIFCKFVFGKLTIYTSYVKTAQIGGFYRDPIGRQKCVTTTPEFRALLINSPCSITIFFGYFHCGINNN